MSSKSSKKVNKNNTTLLLRIHALAYNTIIIQLANKSTPRWTKEFSLICSTYLLRFMPDAQNLEDQKLSFTNSMLTLSHRYCCSMAYSRHTGGDASWRCPPTDCKTRGKTHCLQRLLSSTGVSYACSAQRKMVNSWDRNIIVQGLTA